METIKIEFENELGAQYVEMRVFKSVPWAVSKKIATAGAEFDATKLATMDEKALRKNDEAKMKIAEVIAMSLCVGGNVLNAWTGEAMSFPLNEESVQDAPGEMLAGVLGKFTEMKGDSGVPNA